MSRQVEPTDTDRPPLFGTWKRFYWVVILSHALLILLFYLLTKWYS
ncbi:MAG: hypothetical protein KA479_07775 [Saprospiraceae bacterium]|nr:hypothetical protein [Saprospiraceae bacterium]